MPFVTEAEYFKFANEKKEREVRLPDLCNPLEATLAANGISPESDCI